MPGIGDLLGNGALEQIFVFQVIGQLLAPVLQPFTQTVTNAVNSADPQVPISPADAALAVIRNIMSLADAAAEAAKSGVPAGDFNTLVAITGDAPAPEQLAEALRRGFIDQATYTHGIEQGRLRDEWAPLVQQLAVSDPTPTLALSALLKGQTDQATATGLYEKWGGNPDYFQIAFDTEGAGPSPIEAGTLANRGIIPWTGDGADATSFDQAFRESQYRPKWADAMKALAVYLPPPRTVTALVKEGALTDDQATKLFEQTGLSPELAAAYLVSAHLQKTTTARELSQSEVTSAYADGILSRADAASHLVALGHTAADVDVILAVEDFKAAAAATRSLVSRMHTLFVNGKITATQATAALAAAKLPVEHIDQLLTAWGLEASDVHRTLSAGEIASAWFYQIITIDDAMGRLVAMGYQPADAFLVLEIRGKGPLNPATGQPPATTPPAGG
jgi:hypothetical protein